MTQTPPKDEHENAALATPRSRWVEPRLSRLSAGNAESSQNSGLDGSSEFS